ncbi:MAG TPA: HAMP domain-containing sensor histidine kinase [Steroidobacteraceae bacterium]
MFAAKDSFSVRLPEFMRSTAFRWTLAVSGVFAVCILLLFGFILAEVYVDLTSELDGLITDVAKTIAASAPDRLVQRLGENLRLDPRGIKIAGLFAADGTRIAGNVESFPPGLRVDDRPEFVSLLRMDGSRVQQLTARAIAHRLPEGDTLVLGRIGHVFPQIVNIVGRALTLGLIPALCLGLAAGVFLSFRAQRRLDEVNNQVQHIVAGELRERLPISGTHDAFDRLAVLVNGMLDEIETLVRSLAGVGDDIAHDLRTPLTRVRMGLERARRKATELGELRAAVDQAIVGLDQSLGIITALLRIAEIEHSQRLAGFRHVELAAVVREVADLYGPIAEDKRVSLVIGAKEDVSVQGDRDLLFEAIANLVDNAVKFTPAGGQVELGLSREGEQAIVRVSDTGAGISRDEQDLVSRRFYRSDKSRRDPGLGLGLSLVSAIVKLHGFRFSISPGPGCVAEIVGQRATV